MARQRREFEDQLADIMTMARGARTNGLSTPAMAPVGPDMIEDNAILNEHLTEGAVRLANLDTELTTTLADLAANETELKQAQIRLDQAEIRLDDAFDTLTILPSQLEQIEIDARAAATDMSKVIFQSSKPVPRPGSEKDLWIHTGDGNSPYRYDLAKRDWVKATDTAAIELAKTHANDLVTATKSQILTAQEIAIEASRVATEAAAAANAKLQAESAEARVAATSATAAKKLADAAQAAAVEAAKTYADAQASGAGGVALEAAKADATSKANAAKTAAIAAAALDATAKKEQAEANAAQDAKTKADAALAAAKVDATQKADSARADSLAAAEAAAASARAAAGLASSMGRTWFQAEAPPAGTAHSWEAAEFTSPSILTVDGVERARNLAIHPSPAMKGWSSRGSTGIATEATVATDDQGRSYRRITLTNTGTGAWWRHTGTISKEIVPGKMYRVAVTVRADKAGTPCSINYRWYATAGGWLPETGASLKVGTEWQTFEFAHRASDAAGRLDFDFGGTQASWSGVGAYVDLASVYLTDGEEVISYFDGSFPDDRENDLWIDTDDRNIPKRWNGTDWTEVTDKAAIEAAVTAAAADATAKATKALEDAKVHAVVQATAAQTAAIAAAAADARSQAESAEARAAVTAAADAKAKADAAQAAALAAAKTYADAEASGAGATALAAAKADATAKANAAEVAAITAAATDATAKKEQAEANAALDAKAKADAALVAAKADAKLKADAALAAAKVDATTKADAAKAAAVTAAGIAAQATATAAAEAAEARAAVTAAADAKTKADAAQAAALAAAKTYTEAQASGAGTAALTAAKADATAKADAAKAAAIAAAALDATAKKESAEATAAADAKVKADAALAAAKIDATTKSDAAKNAAILAAAADAQTKADKAQAAAVTLADAAAKVTATAAAEAAEARAATTAAADAKTKADAAQAAALAAAKTYTEAQASGAGTAALTAAKADATAKADAAKAAAIAAAALDATAKKEAAEATAAADAKTKADAALAAAKTDATSKANAAQSAAVAAAAVDATAKANAAQAAAVKAADTAAKVTATAAAEAAEARVAITAAADAKLKADAAQAAALAAAKTYADAEASGASAAALTAAKADATSKANAAQAAATTAAAADATAKKEQAESNAAADAKVKADAALVSAKADAKTKADAALAAAKVDATTKADAAVGTAATFTVEKMNAVANSKNATFYSTSAPSNTASPGTLAGDTWRRKDASGNIIGEWEWSGTAWTQRKMTSASMTAIDVGVLSAGSAVIADAVVKKIAAGTASIQQADIGNLTVTGTSNMNTVVAQRMAANVGSFIELNASQLTASNAVIDQAVVNKLYSEVVESRLMKATQMLIGEPGNMFPDPAFLDRAGWPSNGAYITANAGRNGNNGYAIPASSVQAGSYYGNTDRDRQFAVVPGGTYRVSVWVKPDADVAAKGIAVYMKWTNPSTAVSGSFASPSAISNEAPIKAGVWTEISEQMAVGDTATKAFIGLYVQSSTVVRVVFSEPSVTRATDSALVVKGAITADKLETELVLASRIIAGDPTGIRAEMSPDGFKVFNKAADGQAYETVRMGVASTDDMFAVSDAAGNIKASIDQDGRIVSPSVHAETEIWYKGEELSSVLGTGPRGLVAMAVRDTASPTYDSAGPYPYLALTFDVEKDRAYRISTNPLELTGTGSGLISMHWVDGAQATVKSQLLTSGYSAPTHMGASWQSPVTMNRVFRSWWTGTLSVLVSVRAIGSAQVAVRGDAFANLNHILVEDMGVLVPNTGENVDGPAYQPKPPPAVKNYVTEWTANATRSYLPSGAAYNFNTTKMFQGQSPAGYGNLTSVATFPDMTAALSGATITRVRVYMYFEHWYNNAGGTARIGLVGKTLPATNKPSGLAATSGGWPKPGGRWVDIPSSFFAGFKSGTYGGISLNGDSTYNTYGYANNKPKIQISYTK